MMLVMRGVGVSVGVSVFTLVTISMERYFAICRPLTSLRWQTRRHACRTICVAWLVSVVVMTPTAIYQRLLRMPSGGHKCVEMWDDLYLEKVSCRLLSTGHSSYTANRHLPATKINQNRPNGRVLGGWTWLTAVTPALIGRPSKMSAYS